MLCLRIMQPVDCQGSSCACLPGTLACCRGKLLSEQLHGWSPDPRLASRSSLSWWYSGLSVSCDLVLQKPGFCLLCRCQALLGTAWTHFREKWSGLHPLSQASRHDAVASLQPLAEVQVDHGSLTAMEQKLLTVVSPLHGSSVQCQLAHVEASATHLQKSPVPWCTACDLSPLAVSFLYSATHAQ